MARTKQTGTLRKARKTSAATETKSKTKAEASTKGKDMGKIKKGKKENNAVVKVRKPHRWRAGTVVKREIRKLQESTDLLIRKRPFNKLVREIGQDYNVDMRYEKDLFDVLQEMAEMQMVRFFTRVNRAAAHAKRITIKPEDIFVTKEILSESLCAQNGATPMHYMVPVEPRAPPKRRKMTPAPKKRLLSLAASTTADQDQEEVEDRMDISGIPETPSESPIEAQQDDNDDDGVVGEEASIVSENDEDE